MVRNTLKGLGLLLLLSMCEQEEKIQPRAYPRVRTLAVSEITEKGALFQGKVFYAPSPMVDHGFIWSTLPNLNLNNAEVHSLGSLASTGDFEARIVRSLKKGITYYVRAYAKTETYEVYGDPIPFVSLGSDAPVITSLQPEEGSVLDTIRVIGKNFSKISANITVRFDTLRSTLVEATDSVLRVIVPGTLAIPSATVSVSVLGNTGTSPMPFSLIGPNIASVSPVQVASCDTLRISGSDFSTLPNSVQVRLNGVMCPIQSVAPNLVLALVPSFTPPNSSVTVEVTSSNLKTTYPTPLTYQAPSITVMSPTSNIGYLDTLTFTGAHLPLCGPLAVTLGTLNAVPIQRSTTSVRVVVPQTLTNTSNAVKLDFGNGGYVYQTSLSLADPVITSISPSSATFGEVITITGDFFHPLLANNTVQVGNASATIISATRTQLRATINNGSSICSANNSCNTVNVIVGDRVAESNAFSLKKPVITSISPLPLGNPGLVTITGEFFSPGPDNYVNLNDYRLAASFNSSTSITVDMTRHVLSDNNPIFSSERMDSLWVSVGDADPTHPESLYSNAIDVQVNYVGPWTQMNNFTGGHRATPMTFSINNKAYLVGGFFSPGMFSSEVWEYTAATDTWRRLADFPGGTRWAGVSFAHNGLGYIGMGEGDNGLYKDVWEFDPVTEVWTRLADFPGEARKSAFSFTTGGLTYVGGGDNETPTAPLDFWAFEPTSKTWTSRQDLPKPFFSALAFNTNTGGYVAELPELWNYNPSTNSWTQKASPGLSPISAHIYKATGLGQYDRGFIFSGTSDYFYMYDPYQDNWTPLVSIGSPGYGRTSFTIGQLFYYGLGRRGNGTVTSEIYQLDISKYPN